MSALVVIANFIESLISDGSFTHGQVLAYFTTLTQLKGRRAVMTLRHDRCLKVNLIKARSALVELLQLLAQILALLALPKLLFFVVGNLDRSVTSLLRNCDLRNGRVDTRPIITMVIALLIFGLLWLWCLILTNFIDLQLAYFSAGNLPLLLQVLEVDQFLVI